jgi:hypothetical protein
VYKITITMTSNIAMTAREQEQVKNILDDMGYETIRIEQKEVEPKAASR